MRADEPVCACQRCEHFREIEAYRLVRLIGKKADGRALPPGVEIADLLYCRRCRRRVPVIITAPLKWA